MKILLVAFQKNGKPATSAFELITAARQLNGDLVTVVLAEDAGPAASELANRGAGRVLALSNSKLGSFNDEVFTKVISELIGKHAPDLVLGSASFYGKALFARLAGSNGGKMASDVTSISIENDQVVAGRLSYGGSVVSNVVSSGDGPFFVTVRPKIYPESTEGSGEVIEATVAEAAFESRTSVTGVNTEGGGKVSLTEADIIVSAGRGMKGKEHLGMVAELADSLGAAMGASRAIVDAGWIEYSHQVGQTGKTVNPKLYIAVGISGAIQHLVGMRTAQTIVAINKDKDAPIFKVANYGIVGDAFEILPALTAKFKRELQN